MASTTEICNMALSHLGVGKDVGNSDTENTPEARTFRRFYETARDAVLRDFPWPFATVTAPLALVTDDTDPSDITAQWEFRYRYPSDCLNAKRIVSNLRNDNRQSRIPFKIEGDGAGALILSNWPNAVLEYTSRVTTTSLFAADFTLALTYRLACYMATRVTGGDPFKLAPRCLQAYQMELSSARGNAANEEASDIAPEAEVIRARDGDMGPYGRFPFGGG